MWTLLLGVACCIALQVGCRGGSSQGGNISDAGWADAEVVPGSDDDAGIGWLPLAPSETDFSWQGSQRRLAWSGSSSPNQNPCVRANIAVAMWDRAVCYAAQDGELMCAGGIGETVFGPAFVPAGLQDVVQLLGSPTFNTETNSAVCALKSDGTAWCLGSAFDWGQFRTADKMLPGTEWTQWGDRDDITELSTGSMDSICARYSDRTADCVGYMAPAIDETNVNSLWVDGAGMVRVNEPQIFRVGNSVSMCVVDPQGLACIAPPEVVMNLEMNGAQTTPHGTLITATSDAGKIVDGNAAGEGSICWLTARGSVSCYGYEPSTDPTPESPMSTKTLFAGNRAIAIALNYYSRTAEPHNQDVCAAMSDGSLWCIGDNYQGKFGAGSMTALTQETQVQPPGSVRINCSQAP